MISFLSGEKYYFELGVDKAAAVSRGALGFNFLPEEAVMRFEREFRERCAARGMEEAAVSRAWAWIENFDREARNEGFRAEDAPLGFVELYLGSLLAGGLMDENRILSLARYFLVAGAQETAIRLLAYLLPIGVLPAMAERLGKLEGKEAEKRVMQGIHIPPPGSPPEAYPAATAAFTRALEAELGPEEAHRVLGWNVHGIPASSFAGERERFLELGSVEAWLADYHGRQVEILAAHAREGKLWFEQKISQEVVDFVQREPEILGGVRRGKEIFVTKIPYDPDRYLGSADPLERRRLACHCPLAASAIGKEGAEVPAAWCACSAGYEKQLFDAVFGEETECKVLESVLGGGESCRFSITIPARYL